MRYRLSDLLSTAERRYALVGSESVVCLLSLIPAPSPLFHLLFLPLLMTLNKHDRPLLLALNFAFFATLLLSRLIQLGGADEMPLLVAETSGTVTITTSTIICHQRIIATLLTGAWTTGEGRSSSIGGSLSFGILWAAVWAAVGYDDLAMSLTPSAARYSFLRRALRFFGEAGIDILLGTSAYTLFTTIDGVLDHSEDEQERTGGAGWEWIRLAVLRSLATRSPSHPSASRSASVVDSYPDSPSWSGRREYPSRCTQPHTSTRRQCTPWATTTTSTATRYYGSTLTRQSGDLIDLESGPTRATIGVPGGGTHSVRPDSNASSTSSPPPSTTSSVPLGKADSEPVLENQDRQNLITAALLILLLVWASLLKAPLPAPVSLSSPISVQTPLSIACVLPPSGTALSGWIYHSQMVAGRSKLLVWPNGALFCSNRDEVERAVDAVHRDVAGKYGIWVMMGVAIGNEQVTSETIMVGPEGRLSRLPGESSPRDEVLSRWHAGQPWTIKLPPPHGVVRVSWTHDFPHLRRIHVATINTPPWTSVPFASNSLPSLLVVTPKSSSSRSDLVMTTDLAIRHGVPAITCASSLSRVVDPWGNPLFQQVGGETWSLNLGLSFRDGQERPKTGYEQLGDLGTIAVACSVLLCILLVELGLGRARRRSSKPNPNELEGSATDVDGWMSSIARRWRGSMPVSPSATPRMVSSDTQAYCGSGSNRTE